MEDEQVLGRGRFLQLLSRDGWEYIHRTNCSGIAVIVAVTEDDRLLLVEQYRPPIRSLSIELPAGLIADGEDVRHESGLEAARRELWEETGYEAPQWREVFQGPGGAGASADILTFFIANQAHKTASGGGDASENIRVHAVPRQDLTSWLEAKCAQGIPVDPKIYAGLYLYQTYNKTFDTGSDHES